MKILIAPMAAMAETSGPSSRCRLLAEGFRREGFDVATCMAKDVNYKLIDGIPNYHLEVPMPLGLPKIIATRAFPVAQKTGLVSRKTVKSFDQVLHLTGNLDYRYLKASVSSLRTAMQEYKPDIVYSEFNLSAFIAAKKEGITLYTTVSYPTQYEYSHQKGFEKGMNRLLEELDLPRFPSPLCLFDWADKSFCMSIRELEPFKKPDIVYCGTLKKVSEINESSGRKNKIVIYMGNGTVSAKETMKVAEEAYKNSGYEVYIASGYLKEGTYGNVHVAQRWNFDQLLKEAVLFINHGGQNSIVDGLLYGVPQIIVPGKVFERKYNAQCILSNKAGEVLMQREFNADRLRNLTDSIMNQSELPENAASLGRKLLEAGGLGYIINEVKR